MPCNSPNKVFYNGINRETGKKKIIFTSRNTDFIYRRGPDDGWIFAQNDSAENVELFRRKGYQVLSDSDLVPCGQCLGCRLDYARQWTARIMAEKKNYPDDLCWFITLTYDDDHLPERRIIPEYVDDETGEVVTAHVSDFRSVSKVEHQKFIKRLRKEFQPKTNLPIRYFGCGEYGSISQRPHYHYIIFGLKLDDLQFYKSNKLGDPLYNSEQLSRCWSIYDNKTKERVSLGYVTVGSVTADSAGYCARYCLKKQRMIQKQTYEKLGIDPEFVCMSTKPAIGSKYFEDNYDDLYYTDEMIIPGRNGIIKMKPPKYFDTLLDRIDPDRMESIKESRKLRAKAHDDFIEDYMPFLDKEVQYKTKERLLKKKTMLLNRRSLEDE